MSGPIRHGPVLEARGLVAGWGRRPVLDGVSTMVRRGERVGLLGPNGSGKTTLFDTLSGHLKPRAGHVLLSGNHVTGFAPHRMARLGLGLVPQGPSVFPDLSVLDNLRAALDAPAARRPLGADVLDEVLAHWRLEHLVGRKAAVLSGGERRRLEVARTLLLEPAVLLLDEPFAGLDPAGRAALRSGLDRLPRATALLMTDHAADDVLATCERVLVLIDGRLVTDTKAVDFARDSPRHRRYFGA